MRWEDTAPRKAINFGAAFGIPDKPTLFQVCILRVLATDPLPPAFQEFWRRVLSEGVVGCSDRWKVLLLQMNLLAGGFTCVFTDRYLQQDEPPVFKFSSAVLEAECYALPQREPGDPREALEYRALEGRCLNLVRLAFQSVAVAILFWELQRSHGFSILYSDFYRKNRVGVEHIKYAQQGHMPDYGRDVRYLPPCTSVSQRRAYWAIASEGS